MSETESPEPAKETMTGGGAVPALAPPPTLPRLIWVFARMGLISFGGGLTGWIYREVVERQRWLKDTDALSGLALCQIMPGINVVNLLVYVGQRLHGWRGSIAATLSLLLPPIAITIGLATGYAHVSHLPWVHRFLEGVGAAAVGLTLSVGFRALRHCGRRAGLIAVFLATFVGIGVLRWPMIPVVICTAPAGILIARYGTGRGRA